MAPDRPVAAWSSKTYTIADVEFFVTDSGAPPNTNNDYTTVVLLHGAGFNGYCFYKLHSLAHTFNLRTVALNRRNYSGSTPFTADELLILSNGEKAFVDRLGMHFYQFLKCFVDEEGIPKIDLSKGKESSQEERPGGGLVLVGWSLGAQTLLSIFSDLQDASGSLEDYVKDVVFYDPPFTTFGYSLPFDSDNNGKYLPWLDPANTTLEAIQASYLSWTGSYFDNHLQSGAESTSVSDAATVMNQLDTQSKFKDKVTIWTEEDIEACAELEAMLREVPMTTPPIQTHFATLAQRVMFDTSSSAYRFQHAALTYISPSRTIWICGWAVAETKRRYREAYLARDTTQIEGSTDPARPRPIRFIDINGANHFVHWDQPKEFLNVLVDAIRKPRASV